ncbi:MAG: ClpXP protease specificity-enhancing factor [Thiopseudomonas sp.]|nr:ClpXP protease specificity-enhancing factor [Thiopseudomonas sp.]
MTPSKPYIMRALYEWIVDNECTPYMIVAVDAPGVSVPEGYAENGQMVLNLSPSAVRSFSMSNTAVSFEARFGGVPQQLFVPVYAVLAVYAQENGQGMYFEPESPPEELEEEPPAKPARPGLRVVK